MPINPNIAFFDLVNNPEPFLKRYPIRIYGTVAPSGVAQYALENRGGALRPGSILGTKKLHGTEAFNIRATASGIHAANSHIFQAHSVHMDLGYAAMLYYRLNMMGPNIVVTGQLSGCTYVIQPAVGGGVDVAHIQPVGGMTGATLAANIKANHPNAFVYGATAGRGFYDSDKRVVSIVGVRIGGGWSLYSQKQDPAGQAFTIRSVYRIYPNHTKL